MPSSNIKRSNAQASPVSLKPYDRNPNTHSDEHVSEIIASIQEFGITHPVLVDEDDVILAGHAVAIAAERLQIAKIPVVRISGLTEEQKRAYRIVDNNLAKKSEWDLHVLAEEIHALELADYDTSILGFSDADLENLARLLGTGGGTGDPDATPPIPDVPVSLPGDVWIMGSHRVVCGDSTQEAVVQALLGDVRPSVMVTDPPYGVSYNPHDRARLSQDGTNRAEGDVQNDHEADWREAWALFPGDVAYVWHGMRGSAVVLDSLEAHGYQLRSQIVWVKSRAVISPANISLKTAGYSPQHECCYYAIRKKGAAHWKGGRKQSTVWQMEHAVSETGHAAQKPVEAMARPIRNNTSPGQAVYDPFLGSGTTLIACETTERVCFGVEIEPKYVDLIVMRWQDFTGNEAILESTGEPFDRVRESR